MSYETIRISELAKELGLQSKEVIEKFAQMGITGKTHSSTVTVDQISRLKDFIANGGVKSVAKPKAFVVKKAKQEPEPVVEEKKETPVEKKPVVEKVVRVERVERPKVEVVKPASRLEIVRKAPRKPEGEEVKSEKLNKPFQKGDKKFPPRGEKPTGDKKFVKGEKPAGENKEFGNKKPLERRIIPQEIYDNKSGQSNSKRRSDNKKKEKDFNSKKKKKERKKLKKKATQQQKKKEQKTKEGEEIKKRFKRQKRYKKLNKLL